MPVQRPLTEELKYTQSKIESNFSNFSAWHYRTKTLAAIWEENGASPEDVKKAKDKEFELVTQALWTDPGDQSGWLYHSWLIGQSASTDCINDMQTYSSTEPPLDTLQRELKNIQELFNMEPDSKCAWLPGRKYLTISLTRISGCINALAQYTLRLAKQPSTAPEEADKLRKEAKRLYEILIEVDADRKERYRDMGEFECFRKCISLTFFKSCFVYLTECSYVYDLMLKFKTKAEGKRPPRLHLMTTNKASKGRNVIDFVFIN